MSHGYRRKPLLAAVLGCLLAAGALAADEVPPDSGFLEFLGSWSEDEAVDDWLDFLDSIAGESAETPAADAPVEHGTDDEKP